MGQDRWQITICCKITMCYCLLSGENTGKKCRDPVFAFHAEWCAASAAHDVSKLDMSPLAHITSLICKLRAGYSFSEASALKQVRKSNKPILFIHGADDAFVPVAMLEPLYAATPGYKEREIYPNSGHGLSFVNHQAAYIQRVQTFINKFVK